MGIDPRQLGPAAREAIAKADKARRGSGYSDVGVGLLLRMDPPTVTHHAKRIAGNHLKDSKALKSARRTYMFEVPRNPGLPIRPPVGVSIQFIWKSDRARRVRRIRTPDLDNCNKLLQDVLVAKGWIERDEQVAFLQLEKFDGPTAGVTILLEPLPFDEVKPRGKSHPPAVATSAGGNVGGNVGGGLGR
jgi:Holliday junction resolvase RusA-like endonuclease